MKVLKIIIISFISIPYLSHSQENLNSILNKSFKELSEMKISSSTKQAQRISDIPNSVTLITRDDIQRYGYRNLEELLKHAPGLYILENTEDNLLGIRGNAFASVLFLHNGLPFHPNRVKGLTIPTRGRYNIPIQSIDRIEITRGPQSVIYGNNAFLGTINIVTNDTDDQNGLVSAGYGNNDNSQAFIRIVDSLDDVKLVLNSGFYHNGGLQGKYSDMMSASQQASLSSNMHSDLGSQLKHKNFNIDLSLSLKEWEFLFQYSNMNYGFYSLTPGFDEGSYLDLSSINTGLKYEKKLKNDWTVRWTLLNSTEKYDLSQTDFILPNQDWYQIQSSQRLETELNLIYNSVDNYSLLLGLRYQRLYDIDNEFDFAPLLEDDVYTDPINSYDVFSQFTYIFSPKFSLITGARLSYIQDYSTILPNAGEKTDHGTDNIRPTFNIAGIYKIDDEQTLKLIYSEATQDNRARRITEPEEIRSLELEYQYSGEDLLLSVSLFRNDTNKVLRSVLNNNLTGNTDNTGRWITNGIEVFGKYNINQNLIIDSSVTWQNTDDKNNHLSPGNSPHLLGKLGLSYIQKKLTSSIYLNYVSSMKADWLVSGTQAQRIGDDTDDFLTVGMNLRYEINSKWNANLNISNLFDKKYNHPATELVNLQKGLNAEGRIVYFTLSYNF